MLTCQQMTELGTAYLDGELRFVQRISFRLHLGMCRHCRTYLRQLEATIDSLRRLPAEPLPSAVEADLLQRFRGWRLGDLPRQ